MEVIIQSYYYLSINFDSWYINISPQKDVLPYVCFTQGFFPPLQTQLTNKGLFSLGAGHSPRSRAWSLGCSSGEEESPGWPPLCDWSYKHSLVIPQHSHLNTSYFSEYQPTKQVNLENLTSWSSSRTPKLFYFERAIKICEHMSCTFAVSGRGSQAESPENSDHICRHLKGENTSQHYHLQKPRSEEFPTTLTEIPFSCRFGSSESAFPPPGRSLKHIQEFHTKCINKFKFCSNLNISRSSQ